jgi:hypothetical protein
VIDRNDGQVDRGSRAGDGHVSGKVDASVKEGIAQRDRIGMNGSDDIGAGSEVLSVAIIYRKAQGTEEKEPAQNHC